ncbi:MAG TPA: hypothetical protein VIU61_23370 [Kofleriaceae bacterium]
MKWLVVVLTLLVIANPVAAKPMAPVELRMESTPIAGGHRVALIATPLRALPALELRLAGKTVVFPATRAGQVRRLVVTISLAPGLGRDLVGTAVIARRTRAAILRVGAAAAPQLAAPPVVRTLPDGRRFAEAR